jgi:hypothetical protein
MQQLKGPGAAVETAATKSTKFASGQAGSSPVL